MPTQAIPVFRRLFMRWEFFAAAFCHTRRQQATQPETQRSTTQNGIPHATLKLRQRADTLISNKKRLEALWVEAAIVRSTPIVGNNRQVIQPCTFASVVEIEDRGQLIAHKERVVMKQIRVNPTMGQLTPLSSLSFLERQFVG